MLNAMGNTAVVSPPEATNVSVRALGRKARWVRERAAKLFASSAALIAVRMALKFVLTGAGRKAPASTVGTYADMT